MIVLNSKRRPTRFSGVLIDFEGIDGSGKTTALTKAYERLLSEGYDVILTTWDDSKLTGKALKKGKKKQRMTPLTFTLLQAANFADRLQKLILPHLRKGGIVIADRWMYTSFARDVVRGNDRDWVRKVYEWCPEATLPIYFKLDPQVALDRKENFDDESIAYYEAGADLYPDLSRKDGFLKFQGQVKAEYERFVDDYGFSVVDANQDMDAVEADVTALVDSVIGKIKKAA